MLQVAATAFFIGALQQQLVRTGHTARISLLGRGQSFLVLDGGVRGAEDDAVDAGFAEHDVSNDFSLVNGLGVLGSVQL